MKPAMKKKKSDVEEANKMIHIFNLYHVVLSGMFWLFGQIDDDHDDDDEHLSELKYPLLLTVEMTVYQMRAFKW